MLKRNPEDSEAHYHLALTYARMNRKEEAQAALQTASSMSVIQNAVQR